MQIEYIFLIVIVIASFIALAFFVKSQLDKIKPNEQDQVLTQWLNSMQQTLEQTNSSVASILNQNNKNVTDTLNKSSVTFNKRIDHVMDIFGDVSKELTKMNEVGKSMKDLQLLLQSPKLRGNIGEEVLADLLGQVFPKSAYQLQYGFKSGAKVDAAIKTTAGILCVDAKFPMENFIKLHKCEVKEERNKIARQFALDVRKHIKDISAKYILPEEETVDFAFMYIPSEAIFNEIANNAELIDFARGARVYPVSPNTLYAHLQTVLLAFEGQKFEKKSREIMRLFQALQKDQVKMEENLSILGRHLNNASNQFSNAQQQFNVMGQKLQNRELLNG